jgi:HAD superfamily hydrolase (TIGR01490 family)
MAAQGAGAAFFDLDGTLMDGYVWQAFTRQYWRHRFRRVRLLHFLALHLPLWPLSRLGLISHQFFYHAWGENMAWLVRGLSSIETDQVWQWLVEKDVLRNLRESTLKSLQRHRSAGHRIVLLSGTFQPLLERIGVHLLADDCLGTGLEIRQGWFTGKIIPPLNIGRAKAQSVAKYFTQYPDLSPGNSYFYTDSIVDLPVLEMVGNPVAVSPDPELAALARKNGWEILAS